MRPLLLIIALTVSKLSFSQSSQDTAIQKRQLDSIESVVYKLKDSLRRTQYENNVLINCYTVDTTIYGKDSIIIRYKSKSGKLIKIYTKNNLQSDGLYDYEKLEYLNGMGARFLLNIGSKPGLLMKKMTESLLGKFIPMNALFMTTMAEL